LQSKARRITGGVLFFVSQCHARRFKIPSMKTTIPSQNSVIRSSLFLILLLACFALVRTAEAVSPPPDGGYPGFNTAEGQNALFSLDVNSGFANTAVGWFSLFSNVDGDFNTAIGAGALLSNITGFHNRPDGVPAGSQNTAVGAAALLFNTDGGDNTAVGVAALLNNTTGAVNTAVGSAALRENTDGDFNTAVGQGALFNNTSGQQNTAVGFAAMGNNPPGNFNTAVGIIALGNTTGNGNIALGNQAGLNLTTGDNNIYIGNSGNDGESSTIRIGVTHAATFIAGIRGVTTGNADAINVVIDSAGQLGTMSSSRRFKTEIKPIDKASEAVLALKPVTFHYKSDKTSTPQFGLVAEEVAEVNSDLVVRDETGEIYTVRYEAVNAMLLNEFLKAHRKIEEQEAAIANQQKQIEALASGLQKVSAQLELNKPPPQTVMNNE
jgi:hypothetical protein